MVEGSGSSPPPTKGFSCGPLDNQDSDGFAVCARYDPAFFVVVGAAQELLRCYVPELGKVPPFLIQEDSSGFDPLDTHPRCDERPELARGRQDFGMSVELVLTDEF